MDDSLRHKTIDELTSYLAFVHSLLDKMTHNRYEVECKMREIEAEIEKRLEAK